MVNTRDWRKEVQLIVLINFISTAIWRKLDKLSCEMNFGKANLKIRRF